MYVNVFAERWIVLFLCLKANIFLGVYIYIKEYKI